MAENDVKIYQSKAQRLGVRVNLTDDFDNVNRQRANGNLEKARQLGKRLSQLTPSLDGEGLQVNLQDILPKKYLSQDILYQIKVLLVFEAEALLELEIPVPVLATTAINSLHDELRKSAPGFHKNISDGAAFTFYFLAMKKSGDVSQNIGEAFAMLCSVKNKEGYVEAGRSVWNFAANIIQNEIRKADFDFGE